MSTPAAAATTIVLAAHGERGGAGANARTLRLVEDVRAHGGFGAVTAGFFKGDPPLDDAVRRAATGGATRLVVVPLLMADGYFARRVLPGAVARGAAACPVILAPPVGCEPALRQLVAIRAAEIADERGWTAPSVVVAGHGTARDPRSRRTTEAAAALLREDGRFGRVAAAFLDDEPDPAAALAAVGAPAIVIPYLWSAGRHGLDDLRARLCDEGGRVALDRPLGEDRRVARIVIEALSRMAAGGQAPNEGRCRPAYAR